MSSGSSSTSELFGLTIQGGSCEEILAWAFSANQTGPRWIVTANPEILLEAKRNANYAAVLRQADYLSVDGMGLFLALRSVSRPVSRVTGVALAEALIERAAHTNLCVGFIGGDPGVAEEVGAYWRKRYPSLKVVTEEGGKIQSDGSGDLAEEEALHRLVLAAPDLLFVAFGGGGTKQESWIAKRVGDIPSLKIVVGVGGAFDFWSKRIRRAPGVLQRLGLEWAWRLIQEPRRIKRILRATVVFPIVFFVDQVRRPGFGRTRMLQLLMLAVRLLFFLLILCPALFVYLRAVFREGLRKYDWRFSDLIVPLVIIGVIYPILSFILRIKQELSDLYDKSGS